VYRSEGLVVRRRGRKKLVRGHVPLPIASHPNEWWTMDFVRDTLAAGSAFRALTMLDTWTREALGIEVDVSLPGERVVAALDAIAKERGYPISSGPASRWRTRLSKASTASSGTSA
jgi:putative transposase